MAEEKKTTEPLAVKINQHMDVGTLLYEDTQSYAGIDMAEFSRRTADNLCSLYRQLYDIKKAQDAKHGEDGEILEHSRDAQAVNLSKPSTILPREKPAPKEVVKTKWEKFREERGLPPRKKRSRLVFDEITNDWVPRWGSGSIKKIEEKHNWLMMHKPKHELTGLNPFDYAKLEKKGKLEKQNLAELRNKVNSVSVSEMRSNKVQILDKKTDKSDAEVKAVSSKIRTDAERTAVRKREHKALMKSLSMAQLATAGMGKFDKKLKNEPDAPKTQRLVKKKSNKALGELE
jgi:regulator of ribosome biosynthesis